MEPWPKLIPLAGFLKLLDLAFDDVSLQGAQMIQEENAVQVIDLVEQRTRKQFFASNLNRLAVRILRLDRDLIRARDRFAKTGNAEAALFARLLALLGGDFRVNDDNLFGFVLADTDVDHRDLFADADLRRGQANTLGCVHGLPHICDQLVQFLRAELGDPFGLLFQDRLTILDYLSDHCCRVAQRLVGFDLGEITFVIALRFAKGVTAELLEEGLP